MNGLKEKAIEFIALNNENHILLVAPVKAQFIELFTSIFGKPPTCASCGDKVAKEYAELVDFARGTHSIHKYSMSAYKLKNHKSIFDPVTNRYYIYKSPLWTDEIALNILSTHPQLEFRFVLPNDHAERLQAYLDARALVNGAEVVAKVEMLEPVTTTVIEGDNVVVNDEVESKEYATEEKVIEVDNVALSEKIPPSATPYPKKDKKKNRRNK